MKEKLLHKLEHDLIKKRDFSLIKSALNGNKKSFGILVSFYKAKILSIGKRFFHNDADAEDFVQDVFIRVYLNLDTFRGESLFSTWLMKLAYTTAINSIKTKKESNQLEDEEIIPDSKILSPENQHLAHLARRAIRNAIKELPEKYSVCIEMYFFYDISYRDISEITEFPINTVKSYIFRAKKMLKEKLEALDEDK